MEVAWTVIAFEVLRGLTWESDAGEVCGGGVKQLCGPGELWRDTLCISRNEVDTSEWGHFSKANDAKYETFF
jgi:hypothetical protein